MFVCFKAVVTFKAEPRKAEEVYSRWWLSKDHILLYIVSDLSGKLRLAERTLTSVVAVETLRLSGLGSFVAVKAYY